MLLKHNLISKKCGVFGPNFNFEKCNTYFKRPGKDWRISSENFCADSNFNSKGKMCKNLLIASFVGVALHVTTRLRILSSMRGGTILSRSLL